MNATGVIQSEGTISCFVDQCPMVVVSANRCEYDPFVIIHKVLYMSSEKAARYVMEPVKAFASLYRVERTHDIT